MLRIVGRIAALLRDSVIRSRVGFLALLDRLKLGLGNLGGKVKEWGVEKRKIGTMWGAEMRRREGIGMRLEGGQQIEAERKICRREG
jgi:hypothetical protein